MRRKITFLALLCAAVFSSQAVHAQSWQATAGAQSPDKKVQALAFLPNDIWIHEGDSVTWTFPADEPHTVTFLKPGQVRPTYTAGCPGTSVDGSTFDNSACVNSGRIPTISTTGTTYTVAFPIPGNYKLVCLVHANMTGMVHVLGTAEPLPHDQDFYNRQASSEQRDLLSDRDGGLGKKFGEEAGGANPQVHNHDVVTGTGEIVSTTGGLQSVSLMRFMRPTVTIHAGETVEWASSDVSGHTITFGQEPANVTPETPPSASAGVSLFSDDDGARHAILTSPTDSLHSGRIAPGPQDRTGLAQAPPGVTLFRVTFTNPGIYPYICAFHDELGMTGEVIVLP
jgi:plastocyanin